MSRERRIFLLLFILITQGISAQERDHDFSPKVLFTGSVDVGYTFHAGFTYGVKAGCGLIRFQVRNTETFAGISAGYHTFRYTANRFNVISLSSMFRPGNYSEISLGLARTWYKWGLGNRNKSSSNSFGLYYDICARFPEGTHSLAIGYRAVSLNNRCLGFVTKKARTFYGGYKYDLYR
jgi:hypothetical protein